MKAAEIITILVVLGGLALLILPAPRDRPSPDYHAPQRSKLRNTGKALVVFQDYYGRKIRDCDELKRFVRLKGIDFGTTDEDIVFTSPDGQTHLWLLYPSISGTEYLVASPLYDWQSERRQLTYRLSRNHEESEIRKEPNQAVEPTTMRVTDPAYAGSAPRMVAAHF